MVQQRTLLFPKNDMSHPEIGVTHVLRPIKDLNLGPTD